MKEKIHKKSKLKLHKLISLYIITTIIVTVISFSKFVTTESSNSVATVALMASEASIDIDLSDGLYPGYKKIIPIVISNKKGEEICEVSQQYIIEIEREESENLPLVYSLYKDESCTEMIEKDENGNYSLEEFKLQATVETEVKYYLKLEWPHEYNDENLAFEIGYLTVNIITTQLD